MRGGDGLRAGTRAPTLARMPELPEVETTRRGIAPHLEGRRVRAVTLRRRDLRWPIPPEINSLLPGRRIQAVRRRAKYLLLDTDAGSALLHLGMSGSLRVLPAGAPARGLAGVSGLATQAGVEARVTVSGEAGPLPSTVEHVAYRIIQEALTNVARHSGTTQAEVRLHYGRDDLLIEVLDRGRGGDPAGGFGLAGMRERVGELGGELTVGARAGGGFAVRVRLPLTKAKVEAA